MLITDIEDYFAKGCGRCERFASADCSTMVWKTGLSKLRDICVGVGLEETVKWGHPCYMHAGRNIAIIGAFRREFRLSFFNAALLKDPHAVLLKQGPNTQHKDMLCFASEEEVDRLKPIVIAYLTEAMDYAQRGISPPKSKTKLVLPDELVEVLDADSELAEAIHSLTPGLQKSYVINLSSAKKSSTRTARIEKLRSKIIAGKGAMER